MLCSQNLTYRMHKSQYIHLAGSWPKTENACELKLRGTVLGVGFDSSNLSWFLAEEKGWQRYNKTLRHRQCLTCWPEASSEAHGYMNDLWQKCPSVKYHKRAGNAFRGALGENDEILAEEMFSRKFSQRVRRVSVEMVGEPLWKWGSAQIILLEMYE